MKTPKTFIILEGSIPTSFFEIVILRTLDELIGFRRRIAALIGYTGGESIGQIPFSGAVGRIRMQPYSLWSAEKSHARIGKDKALLTSLPDRLRDEPRFLWKAYIYIRNPTSTIGSKRPEHIQGNSEEPFRSE